MVFQHKRRLARRREDERFKLIFDIFFTVNSPLSSEKEYGFLDNCLPWFMVVWGSRIGRQHQEQLGIDRTLKQNDPSDARFLNAAKHFEYFENVIPQISIIFHKVHCPLFKSGLGFKVDLPVHFERQIFQLLLLLPEAPYIHSNRFGSRGWKFWLCTSRKNLDAHDLQGSWRLFLVTPIKTSLLSKLPPSPAALEYFIRYRRHTLISCFKCGFQKMTGRAFRKHANFNCSVSLTRAQLNSFNDSLYPHNLQDVCSS